MEYFVYKGIDSRDVTGLIVTSLPPVVRPKMRSRIDTIDGRDGSTVTELGFEAYNKPVKIGLTRNYDIDNIIYWLQGDGDIQFSNEPDKYYRVKVLDQVDFEKLLRFRTATINFYTQPFKYSATERTRTIATTGGSRDQTVPAKGVVAPSTRMGASLKETPRMTSRTTTTAQATK